MRKLNKKGVVVESSAVWWILAISIIVLGVFVVLWISGYKDKIKSYISGNNIQTTIQGCELACNTENKPDFCDEIRVLKGSTDQFIVNSTTGNLVSLATGSSAKTGQKLSSQAKGNCSGFANTLSTIGFSSCPAMPCT